jgi:hypothetical protein
MPIHDWSRVPSGLFHDFHQGWSVEIRNALNRGVMPEGYYAYIEQKTSMVEERKRLYEPDLVAIEFESRSRSGKKPVRRGATATLETPRAHVIQELVESDDAYYARKANRITIRRGLGKVVAAIEIVSPGNKDSEKSFEAFVENADAFLGNGIHLLIVDLFPPTPRDPQGVHKAIAAELSDVPFKLPAGKRRTVVSYRASDPVTAFVEPVAVGDKLPSIPLFLTDDLHVPVPLESTYTATWAVCPAPTRELVEKRK